eukprot:TRINITY_DN11777_c0_g1_i1.p1 TRINITY_DN11777_c0_g1~~TRINITY_DN11777_c0_g1_i1.p1  ORF type:complete len:193 (-),score=22.81 TRINITY_DN11777_c0_g1_i1:13-570(-)
MSVFSPHDLFEFNGVNLDPLTATYDTGYYLDYLTTWPDYNYTLKSPDGIVEGYIFGKAEGPAGYSEQEARLHQKWHGHVTAVTVNADYRRLGLATDLMDILELVTDKHYDGWFVDLFVRASNIAIDMYTKLGYVTYRRVLDYYQDEGGKREDGLDMRKAMPIDKNKVTEKPLGRDITPDELDQTL